ENTNLELNYINQNIGQEDFLSVFNKIASSINNSTNLFYDNTASFLEEFVEDIEEDIEKNTEEPSNLIDDSVNKNSLNLEIENFISLSSKLKSNEFPIEDIVHRNKDFDIDDLINSLN
ncbi:14263_t:CDS:1, partial [Dentiscutata heterogama]